MNKFKTSTQMFRTILTIPSPFSAPGRKKYKFRNRRVRSLSAVLQSVVKKIKLSSKTKWKISKALHPKQSNNTNKRKEKKRESPKKQKWNQCNFQHSTSAIIYSHLSQTQSIRSKKCRESGATNSQSHRINMKSWRNSSIMWKQ